MKKTMLYLSILMLMMGCSAKNEDVKGYFFHIGSQDLQIGEKAADYLAKAGTPIDKYTSPSCAFEGDDTVYDYGSYQITTYDASGTEIFTGFYLVDDSISTKEGIRIGSSFDQMVSAYGDQYIEEYGVYTYNQGLSDLSFVIVEDTVTSISYLHIVD